MKLAPRPPRRRNETRDLTHPIRLALNRMPGVRVARNNVGMLEWDGGELRYGLGTGSADLVGIVTVRSLRPADWDSVAEFVEIGRAFALEVKWPGEQPGPDQRLWLAVVRKLGGFAAVVHSVDEAKAAVTRCREGRSE